MFVLFYGITSSTPQLQSRVTKLLLDILGLLLFSAPLETTNTVEFRTLFDIRVARG